MKTILDTFQSVNTTCGACLDSEGQWAATRYNALTGREHFLVCDSCVEEAGVPDEDGHVSFYLDNN